MISKLHIRRLITMGLRFASLGTKLALTLFMGRYFSLSDIGLYGLVLGAVSMGGCVIGIESDFIVTREVVDAEPFLAARKIRDQLVFLGLSGIVFGSLAFVALIVGALDIKVIVFAFVVLLTLSEKI